MDHFHHKDGALWCEDVPLARLAAEVGTPRQRARLFGVSCGDVDRRRWRDRGRES